MNQYKSLLIYTVFSLLQLTLFLLALSSLAGVNTKIIGGIPFIVQKTYIAGCLQSLRRVDQLTAANTLVCETEASAAANNVRKVLQNGTF